MPNDVMVGGITRPQYLSNSGEEEEPPFLTNYVQLNLHISLSNRKTNFDPISSRTSPNFEEVIGTMCVVFQVKGGHIQLDLLALRRRYCPLAFPAKVEHQIQYSIVLNTRHPPGSCISVFYMVSLSVEM